jgi:hypothetical protein
VAFLGPKPTIARAFAASHAATVAVDETCLVLSFRFFSLKRLFWIRIPTGSFLK